MDSYSDRIKIILKDLRHAVPPPKLSAKGVFASFECGANLRFSIRVESATKIIEEVGYTTNGCGFMVAAAETISRSVLGRRLTDRHGFNDLERRTASEIGDYPANRNHCVKVSAAAFRDALAKYRSNIVEEFQGEKALVCTCFGVTEERILEVIERKNATDVSEVSAEANAGSGCGSCRMLIQELIDARLTDHRF